MASVADLITIVRGIYSACADVGQAKKTVQIAGEKLATVLPVLEMLYDRQHVYDGCKQGIVYEWTPVHDQGVIHS